MAELTASEVLLVSFFKSWISQGSVVFPIILFNMDSYEKDRVYGGVTEFIKAKLNIYASKYHYSKSSLQFSSDAQSCLTLCNPMDCSTHRLQFTK